MREAVSENEDTSSSFCAGSKSPEQIGRPFKHTRSVILTFLLFVQFVAYDKDEMRCEWRSVPVVAGSRHRIGELFVGVANNLRGDLSVRNKKRDFVHQTQSQRGPKSLVESRRNYAEKRTSLVLSGCTALARALYASFI